MASWVNSAWAFYDRKKCHSKIQELIAEAKRHEKEMDKMRTTKVDPLLSRIDDLTKEDENRTSKLTVGLLQQELRRQIKKVEEVESSKAKLEVDKSLVVEENKDLKRNNRTIRRKSNRLKETLKKLQTQVNYFKSSLSI